MWIACALLLNPLVLGASVIRHAQPESVKTQNETEPEGDKLPKDIADALPENITQNIWDSWQRSPKALFDKIDSNKDRAANRSEIKAWLVQQGDSEEVAEKFVGPMSEAEGLNFSEFNTFLIEIFKARSNGRSSPGTSSANLLQHFQIDAEGGILSSFLQGNQADHTAEPDADAATAELPEAIADALIDLGHQLQGNTEVDEMLKQIRRARSATQLDSLLKVAYNKAKMHPELAGLLERAARKQNSRPAGALSLQPPSCGYDIFSSLAEQATVSDAQITFVTACKEWNHMDDTCEQIFKDWFNSSMHKTSDPFAVTWNHGDFCASLRGLARINRISQHRGPGSLLEVTLDESVSRKQCEDWCEETQSDQCMNFSGRYYPCNTFKYCCCNPQRPNQITGGHYKHMFACWDNRCKKCGRCQGTGWVPGSQRNNPGCKIR